MNSEDFLNKVTLIHISLEHRVLAVRDVEINVLCASVLESLSRVVESTSLRTNIVNDKNVFTLYKVFVNNAETLNLTGLPVSLLDAKSTRSSIL